MAKKTAVKKAVKKVAKKKATPKAIQNDVARSAHKPAPGPKSFKSSHNKRYFGQPQKTAPLIASPVTPVPRMVNHVTATAPGSAGKAAAPKVRTAAQKRFDERRAVTRTKTVAHMKRIFGR